MIDEKSAPYAALVLRLILGASFIAHGLLKLLVFTPAGTAKYFASIGLPGSLGYLVMIAELVGGAMLILGIYARFVALVFIPEMLGVIYFVHAANGWGFSNPGGGWEYPAFWTGVLLVQFLLGDGAFAMASCTCNDSQHRHNWCCRFFRRE